MATVHPPAIASHPGPDPFRKPSHQLPLSRSNFRLTHVPPAAPPPNPSSAHGISIHQTSKPDPFYGHEYIARLCARFITHLFTCPEYPPSSTHSQAKLPFFIAYALHRTKLHQAVTFAALVLLQRLKARFPTARGSSGHRLFISAFMIASKVICDDTYSNKSWSIVAQGMFNLREINQMEREMCSYLEWELTVDNAILTNFEAMVKRDFRGPGPYPTYSLQMVSKKPITPVTSTSTTLPPLSATSTSPIPSFGQRHPSPPKPVVPPPPTSTTTATTTPTSSLSTASSHARSTSTIPHTQYSHPHAHHHHAPPPRSASTSSTVSTSSSTSSSTSTYETPPATPDTPSDCSSTSTSPASSASPPTPAGIVDNSAQIAGPTPAGVHHHSQRSPAARALTIRTEKQPPNHPLKGKMYAYAIPSVW